MITVWSLFDSYSFHRTIRCSRIHDILFVFFYGGHSFRRFIKAHHLLPPTPDFSIPLARRHLDDQDDPGHPKNMELRMDDGFMRRACSPSQVTQRDTKRDRHADTDTDTDTDTATASIKSLITWPYHVTAAPLPCCIFSLRANPNTHQTNNSTSMSSWAVFGR